MTPIVCDASVVVAWLVDEAGSSLAQRLPHGTAPLLAPTILLAETTNALLTRMRRGEVLPPGYPQVPIAALQAGSIEFTPDPDLLDSAMTIARRLGHPIYDCFYLALCRRAEAMLATFDARLARHATTLAIPLWRPEDA
ncbi:MAG: type II toxin-antitoxin system VapC family toxin [Acetobacteraceae bacterium]|nr:type II toxin-antitoxin system VapC family toxin [Acetobacteraceae bacterium]